MGRRSPRVNQETRNEPKNSVRLSSRGNGLAAAACALAQSVVVEDEPDDEVIAYTRRETCRRSASLDRTSERAAPDYPYNNNEVHSNSQITAGSVLRLPVASIWRKRRTGDQAGSLEGKRSSPASAVGIRVRPNIENAESPEFGGDFQPYMAARAEDPLVAAWVPLTVAINSVNRSMWSAGPLPLRPVAPCGRQAWNRTGGSPASGLYGAFLVKRFKSIFSALHLLPILWFGRAAGILPPRPWISGGRAQAPSRSAAAPTSTYTVRCPGRILTVASTAASCRRWGGWRDC